MIQFGGCPSCGKQTCVARECTRIKREISYWNCEFADCDDYDDPEEGRIYIYGCSHPDNLNHYCYLDNKWGSMKEECTLLGDKDDI